MAKKLEAHIDNLLEPLVLPAGDAQTDEFLAQLIATHAEPVIKGIIRYKLHLNIHFATERSEADDIYQEAVVQLLAGLQKLREQPDRHPISNLRGFAAIIAHRTCSRWLRRQFPERHALKNRLHYLLTRVRGFAVWRDENDKLMTGFAVWQGRKEPTTPRRLKEIADEDELIGQVHLLKSSQAGDALAAIFDYLGGPIEFDELVAAVVSMLKIRDQPIESADQNQESFEFRATAEPDTAWQVEKRMFLQRLWEEVCQLPRSQRAALLLNLKDADGRGCIALFPATGITSLRQLADALELSAERLAELWMELPIEDARIADLLGITRQQVINARKSARERLTRRLKGFM